MSALLIYFLVKESKRLRAEAQSGVKAPWTSPTCSALQGLRCGQHTADGGVHAAAPGQGDAPD